MKSSSKGTHLGIYGVPYLPCSSLCRQPATVPNDMRLRNILMRRKLNLFLAGLCTLFPRTASAQPDSPANRSDSLYVRGADSITVAVRREKTLPYGRASRDLDRLSSKKWYQMTCAGVPLIACGLIVKGEDTHFRNLRNDYMPSFKRHLDNYTQYAPGVAMLSLKALGVESRSSWGRMLVSDAFSALLMGGIVNTLKHNTRIVRPDGTNNHSFPSGHTATAFMTATMLNKEYGDKSPWIGIGGYTVAAGTGLMRMANNKHWLSDVLTGAGIGILSTEVGYFLADLIFKDRGLNQNDVDGEEDFDRMAHPSFVCLYMGVNVPISAYDIDENNQLETSSGSTAGIEGAYFFSPYIGVGGRLTASSTAIIANKEEAENNSFDAKTIAAGGYVSYPLSKRWLVGSKLLAEYTHYPKLKVTGREIPARSAMGFGSGLSFTFRAKRRYGLQFFLDYDLLPAHSQQSGEHMSKLTAGASFQVFL